MAPADNRKLSPYAIHIIPRDRQRPPVAHILHLVIAPRPGLEQHHRSREIELPQPVEALVVQRDDLPPSAASAWSIRAA